MNKEKEEPKEKTEPKKSSLKSSADDPIIMPEDYDYDRGEYEIAMAYGF